MKTVALSILLLAGAALASPAFAQDAPAAPDASNYGAVGTSENYNSDSGYTPQSIWSDSGPVADRFEAGINALKSKNFARAEAIFARALRSDRNNADANFFLGATRMELGKWEDAKKPLEVAVKKNPRHPDPKSRLAVTYAKLGDRAGASALRADLVKMNEDCKDDCRLSPYILAGIQMIDEALATN